MKMLCPKCGSFLPPEAVNIATDLAQCPKCGRPNRASACLVEDEVNQDVLRQPPPGTWLRQEADAIVIGATMRTKAAWFLVPFTVLYSGITMFIAYGIQIITRSFNLLLSLIGIPFLLFAFFLIGFTINSIFGRQEWRLDEDGGAIFSGVGRFGRRWRFAWKDLTRIHLHTIRSDENEDAIGFKLILEGASPKVEVILPGREDRQQFIVNAIRYYYQQWRRK